MLELNLSAGAVKELKKAIDMGIGVNLSLGIGGQVTVSGGGVPDVLTNADVWFDAREGIAETGGTITSWTDRNGSISATPHPTTGPEYEAENSVIGGAALVWPNSASNEVGLQFADVNCEFVMVVCAYVAGETTTFQGFERLFSGPSSDQVGASTESRWRTSVEQPSAFSETSVKNGAAESAVVLPLDTSVLEFTRSGGAVAIDTIGNFNGSAGRGWRGPIAQIAGWTTKPSASEITAAREYFAGLYGITLA